MCLITHPGIFAQKKVTELYTGKVKEYSKQIWNELKDKEIFREIPSTYAHHSKIILASITDIKSSYISSRKVQGAPMGSRNQIFTEISRTVVKLMDAKAVIEYSELDFTLYRSGILNYEASEKSTAYVGIKIIKPDGTFIIMDPSEIVILKTEANTTEAKLAVRDLNPGDILDFFIATEIHSTNDFSTRPHNIILYNEDPILYLSFHAVLDKNFTFNYRSYNRAPRMQVSVNDKNENVVHLEQYKLDPVKIDYWTNPLLQLPFIRINISLIYSPENQMYRKPENGEVTFNEDASYLFYDYAEYLKHIETPTCKALSISLHNFRSKYDLKTYDPSNNIDARTKAIYAFYQVRFERLIDFDINLMNEKINLGTYRFDGLTSELNCALRSMGENPFFILTNDRTIYRIDEIMNTSEIVDVLYLPQIKQLMSITNPFSLPFEVPFEIDGIKESRLLSFDGLSVREKDITRGPALHTSTAEDNSHDEKLEISLSEDLINLEVKRTSTTRGYAKEALQRQLILYEDYFEYERKWMGIKTSLFEKLQQKNKTKVNITEIRNAFAAARKKQKEAFVTEANNWFGFEISDLTAYKTDTLGVRLVAPNFVYSSSFKFNNLVKKAGNNFIIEIGKLHGIPLSVEEEDRSRKRDIYNGYARSFNYNISFLIPDGYKVEGIEALNSDVKNETGSFFANAHLDGNLLQIKMKKEYSHNYEPLENWSKMLEFLDASVEWHSKKILLKKND